ncbi:hypothetical protein [Saccharothrix sp. NRRL B-16314]|uniref:hypothetical protein n=1 Tax=Saccharothrix sp. NRRL B-16314 TaxID=1463825 RepID=UPI00068AC2ED|nr:hypothetical protein [Saccharothrix sp. NRRL B-16314]
MGASETARCVGVESLSTVNSYFIDENRTDKHAVLHDSILARTLKKTREQGVIVRESCDKSFPPEVMYSSTQAVAEVLTLAEPLIEWTRAHPGLFFQAQAPSRHSGAETAILDGVVDSDSPTGDGRFDSSGRRPRAGGAVG